MLDWSNLPEDLLNFIASRLFSNVELKRFRSICCSWRSSVSGASNNNLVSNNRPLINPFMNTIFELGHNETLSRYYREVFLSRAAFFRVTLSSSSSQGWLIKSDTDVNSGTFRLLDPFSRLPLQHSYESKSLNLLEFTVSEIQEAYAVLASVNGETATEFKRVVLVKVKERDDVLGISWNGDIYCWNGEAWSRIDVNDDNRFSDIIVHKGITYALDSRGVVWWITSDLLVFRYGTSFDKTITNGYCIEKTFVECCEELYIVERFFEEYAEDIGFNYVEFHAVKRTRKTVGFKVYKMDEELTKWIEVKSLGDNAFVMATDACFSVLAHEFYGCLKNSIYFTDNGEKEMKVFKLDDNGNGSSSVTSMSELSDQSCFQMFVPSFL